MFCRLAKELIAETLESRKFWADLEALGSLLDPLAKVTMAIQVSLELVAVPVLSSCSGML